MTQEEQIQALINNDEYRLLVRRAMAEINLLGAVQLDTQAQIDTIVEEVRNG